MAHAAIVSAWEQVERNRRSVEVCRRSGRTRTQESGGRTIRSAEVTLREQYAVESAEKHVDALKLYFESRADYRQAIAEDALER